MYYIVNQSGHIIAADDQLLNLLSVRTIDDLYRSIALGDISLSTPAGQELNISVSGERQAYTCTQHTLSGILGEMTLVQVEEPASAAQELTPEVDLEEEKISLIDDEPITFGDITEERVIPEEKAPEISIMDDDKPFDLMSDTPIEEETPVEERKTEADEATAESDDTPIVIDIESISQKIGISKEDYDNFLNEYIDTALTLEEDLKSTQEKKRNHAISTLSHLSNVLHLPVISDIVEKIKSNIDSEENEHIQALYTTLARLTTKSESTDEAEEETPAESTQGFGTIDLSDVKPIHFDFQMEAAANDLSLPVELIEEFVVDFIEQAHEETKKMLEAYEKGDLETIQKIGHLLKGTSSNLRINPLSDTLYEIQFCEDSSKLEGLIKEYWGHFLSFEHVINMTLKK